MLHRCFGCVERKRAKGVPLRRALRYFAWRWNGKLFRSDPRHKTRFARSTLVALYYRWRRQGRKPEALLLKTNEPRVALTRELLEGFVNLLAVPGVGSTVEAYRGLHEYCWQEGLIERREEFPSRLAFEAAVRGPIRAGMRRLSRAESELVEAHAALAAGLNAGGGNAS